MAVVKTNPASPSENVIQATADVPDLTLRPFSDAQASPVLRVQNAAGTVTLLTIDATGHLTGTGAAPSGAVILAPDTPTRNTIQPTGSFPALIAKPFADDGSTFVNILNANETQSLFGIASAGSGNTVTCSSADDGDFALLAIPSGSTGTQTEDILGVLYFDTGLFQQVRKWSVDGNSNMYWADKTTTAGTRKQASISRSWVDNTDATRKARIIHSVFDTAAREAMRLEADGSAARIGFLGAAAVVRQTGASAAAIAAIVDPSAKAAISALQTALANLGLVTSPP